MAEWFKVSVLKTDAVKAAVGSNPTLSSRGFSDLLPLGVLG